MDRALFLCRFLHFGAAMLFWGGAAYGGARRHRPVLWAILAATGLAWLLLEAGIAGGSWADAADPATLRALLTETHFGAGWMIHLALVGLAGASLLVRRGATVAAGLVLASLALVGHAAMQDGAAGLLHEANAAVHLLSGGYWAGALPSVLAGLGRSGDGAERHRLILFSRRGHWAVALVILSGVANTYLVLGHLPVDPSSPYQLLLGLKIGLVAAMAGLALANRYLFLPRGSRGGRAALRRGAIAEIALSAGVLALVSVFATFDPV